MHVPATRPSFCLSHVCCQTAQNLHSHKPAKPPQHSASYHTLQHLSILARPSQHLHDRTMYRRSHIWQPGHSSHTGNSCSTSKLLLFQASRHRAFGPCLTLLTLLFTIFKMPGICRPGEHRSETRVSTIKLPFQLQEAI